MLSRPSQDRPHSHHPWRPNENLNFARDLRTLLSIVSLLNVPNALDSLLAAAPTRTMYDATLNWSSPMVHVLTMVWTMPELGWGVPGVVRNTPRVFLLTTGLIPLPEPPNEPSCWRQLKV